MIKWILLLVLLANGCSGITVPARGKNAGKDTIAVKGCVKEYEEEIEIRYGDLEKDTTTKKHGNVEIK